MWSDLPHKEPSHEQISHACHKRRPTAFVNIQRRNKHGHLVQWGVALGAIALLAM
ncbi:Uncharacterised protein [Pseudomonas luteola]|uniref:Uncharacterized protein n=1 Tax=Pseudomonas luteola TaxID=47886 RepID=A0A2X2BVC0_PSELU|nr:Uncharacterised protein [Pseudomonas luteola]